MWPFDKLFPKKKPEPISRTGPKSSEFHIAGHTITVTENEWPQTLGGATITLNPDNENGQYLLALIARKVEVQHLASINRDGIVDYGTTWANEGDGEKKPKLSFESLGKLIEEFIKKSPFLASEASVTAMRKYHEKAAEESYAELQEALVDSRVNPILNEVLKTLKTDGVSLTELQELHISQAIARGLEGKGRAQG